MRLRLGKVKIQSLSSVLRGGESMPIFEYECLKCGEKFELLLMGSDVPTCPKCGSRDLKKLMSVFNSNVKKGFAKGSGACSTCSGGSCSTCGIVK